MLEYKKQKGRKIPRAQEPIRPGHRKPGTRLLLVPSGGGRKLCRGVSSAEKRLLDVDIMKNLAIRDSIIGGEDDPLDSTCIARSPTK